MNFLGHAYLSPHHDAILAGNVCADLIKGRALAHLAPGVEQGVRLHRAIDRYTDAHPAFAATRRYIDPCRRRYAPVILDVYFDHCLARDWEHYSTEPFDDFVERTCVALERQRHALPAHDPVRLDRMLAARWLAHYRTVEGIDRVFAGLNRRARFSDALAGASADLERHYVAIEANFSELFAALRRYVESLPPSRALRGCGAPT